VDRPPGLRRPYSSSSPRCWSPSSDLHDPEHATDIFRRSTSRSSRWSSTTPGFPGGYGRANRRAYERILTTTVNDIEHIESQSLNGVASSRFTFRRTPKSPRRRRSDGGVADAIRQMPPARSHRWSFSTTLPTSRSFSFHWAEESPSSSFLTWRSTSCARAGRGAGAQFVSLRWKATQIMVDLDPKSSTPGAFPRPTSPTPSTPRI